jgi:hypothetical protein
VLVALCAALVAGSATLAGAQAKPPAKCFESGPNYELPTCTQDGKGGWTVSYTDGALGEPDRDEGPNGFAALMVLVLAGGIGFTVWKVWMARRMAAEAGMDPGRATAVTLLSDDGLDATYIATSLGARQPASRTAAERLRELQRLREDGLVSADEYDARRRAIVDAL